MPHVKHLQSRPPFSPVQIASFVGASSVVGVTVVLLAFASGFFSHFELENGRLSGGAQVVAANGASGGKAIRFGSSPAATPTPTVVPTLTPPPATGGSLGFPRIPWEGGPSYWAKFSKASAAGWTNPNFFPISVFKGKASTTHVNSLKDAGINLYMDVEHSPDTLPLTNVTDAGIFAMPGQEWTAAEVGSNPKAVAWFISDECDMGGGGCSGDEYSELTQQTSYVNARKSLNDGRFLHANFGNGILRTFWSTDTMNQQVGLLDSASADKYTYTSPDVAGIIDGWHNAPDWPDGVPVPRAYSYGWQADQMRRFQDPAHLKPVWTFVETAKPYLTEAGATTIQPVQIEGAVWSAIIHEARGIAYFQHNNDGRCNYSIVDCPDVHDAVKAINAQVQALAPVINTQSYYNATRAVNGFTYDYFTFNNGTDTMLKTYNGSAYIFADLGMNDATGNKTFTLPQGVNGTSVTVVGENRTIPVSNRTFTDNFAAEYSHHVYQIQL